MAWDELVMRERMPIHAAFFLPARRTDLLAVKDVDLDALHQELWGRADQRNMGRIRRPSENNYLIALLIAQGRCRRLDMKFYVKDPEIWNAEVVDLRNRPVAKGRWRCQLCGKDFERPIKPKTLVACWDCSELVGLRTYFDRNLWDKDGNIWEDYRPKPEDKPPTKAEFKKLRFKYAVRQSR